MKLGVSPVLVGRGAEIHLLSSLLDLALSGQGQIALISGDAGIGKTQLVTATKTKAAQLGFSICQGNCFKPDLTIPYAPLLDLLHNFLMSWSEEGVAKFIGPQVPVLAQLLPDLAVSVPQHTPTPALIPEHEKNHFFYAIEQFLVHLAADKPLLLVIEDIHWSDDTSLDFLMRLVRRLGAQPVLLVLTYRSDEEHDFLTHFLIRLDRGGAVRRIVLAPLTRDETKTMLQGIFAMKQSVTTEFLDAIYGLTEGNPFFIEEVIKSLLVKGDIYFQRTGWDRRPMSQLRIPHTLQVAVQQQVEQLTLEARQVLTLAAVVGRRFDFGLLQALTSMNEETLFARVKELLSAQLLVEETADNYAFRHALTCEALYIALLARERRTYHRQIAQTTEQLYRHKLESHLADLAYHYFEAEEWKEAYEYGQHAGARAQRLDASREASELFTRAVDAAQRLGVQASPGLYRARGQAYETIGEFDMARASYEQALQIAHETAGAVLEWQALLDLGFLWAATDYKVTGEYLRRALDVAQTLGDPRSLAQSLNRMGNWCLSMEQPLEGKQYHQEALAIYEQLNDRRGLAETLDLLGLATSFIPEIAASHAYYEHALALFRELDDRRGLSSSLAIMSALSANYYFDTSATAVLSLAESVALAEMALDLARAIEWRAGEAFGLSVLGLCRGAMGQYTQALPDLQMALTISEEIEHRQWSTVALSILGCIYLDLFALSLARQCLEQALEYSKEMNSPYWIRLSSSFLASVYIHESAYQQAETTLESALDSDAPLDTRAQKTWWAARLELALAEGKLETGLRIGEQLMHAVMAVSPQPQVPWQGAPRLQMRYGEVLAASGHYADAEANLQGALQTAKAQGAAPLIWRIHRALSRLYRSQRRFEAAENEIIAAQSLIEVLAANVPDEDMRQDFLRQTSADLVPRAPSPKRAAKRAFGGLTAREQQVAVLVAQGRSNSEIAAALVLSERTIEKHISNIFNKLGFNRRAQIITWIAEKGLLKNQ